MEWKEPLQRSLAGQWPRRAGRRGRDPAGAQLRRQPLDNPDTTCSQTLRDTPEPSVAATAKPINSCSGGHVSRSSRIYHQWLHESWAVNHKALAVFLWRWRPLINNTENACIFFGRRWLSPSLVCRVTFLSQIGNVQETHLLAPWCARWYGDGYTGVHYCTEGTRGWSASI